MKRSPALLASILLLAVASASVDVSALSFTSTLIDPLRAGGEPVLTITPHGTIIVAAHPGWTHTRYPPSPDLLVPATGQSYLWRSTDHGATWSIPSIVPLGLGPRGAGQGISDPDLALDANGRVYLTDLEGLAAASVSWSDDDGVTWLLGNDIASTYAGGPIDRNWLATHGTDVYLKGNYFVGEHVLKSTDGGVTWDQLGDSRCGGDFLVRDDGVLLEGCGGSAISVSTNGGQSFFTRGTPGSGGGGLQMMEPGLDAAGNVYVAWANGNGVFVAGSTDLGNTWSPAIRVSDAVFAPGSPQTHIWPWVVGGDAGRVAVVWYGAHQSGGSGSVTSDWHVYEATVIDVFGPARAVSAAQVTSAPIYHGPVCQSGTTCQTDLSPGGDRRMGDFFEATVDADGMVNIAYSVVTAGDSISHPGFAMQTGGPSLYVTPHTPPAR
jgi:hypothetical protein